MTNYDFALNKVKLNQAIAKVGVDAPVEKIKEEYIKNGGLLEVEPTVYIEKPTPAITAETVKEATVKVAKKVTKKK